MNNSLSSIVFAFFLLNLCACSKEAIEPPISDVPDPPEQVTTRSGASTYVADEIVIHYEEDYPEDIKQVLRDRYSQEIDFEINYIETSIWDSQYELWKVSKDDGTEIDVNNVITTMKTTDFDEGEVEEDFNTLLILPRHNFDPSTVSSIDNHLLDNGELMIAIIDTGLDYGKIPGNYLVPTRSTQNPDEESGWDFVNEDYDIRDDFGHGTAIAKIIKEELADSEVAPRFIALKAFNDQGSGRLFDFIEALLYVRQHPEINILHMSLGWFSEIENTKIVETLINDIAENTLIICSAGNSGVDIDLGRETHLPCGYEHDHILSVGGYVDAPAPNISNHSVTGIARAGNSNFGRIGVDIVAPYDQYDIQYPDGGRVSLAGTSFSAAYVSARAALLFNEGELLRTWKQRVIHSGYLTPMINQFASRKAIVRDEINQ